MSSTFSKELVGRSVVDSHGEKLGILKDLTFDMSSGTISDFLVEVEPNIDISLLPWEGQGNIVNVPAEQVQTIATKIHLVI